MFEGLLKWGGSYGLSGLLSLATTRACRHFQAVMWASTSFAAKRIGASSRIAGLRQSAAVSCRTIVSSARYSASTRLMTLARVCFIRWLAYPEARAYTHGMRRRVISFVMYLLLATLVT